MMKYSKDRQFLNCWSFFIPPDEFFRLNVNGKGFRSHDLRGMPCVYWVKKYSKKIFKRVCNSFFCISFVTYLAEQLNSVFMFGLLNKRESFSRAAYRLSNRILELASAGYIFISQHLFGFIPTTHPQLQV